MREALGSGGGGLASLAPFILVVGGRTLAERLYAGEVEDAVRSGAVTEVRATASVLLF